MLKFFVHRDGGPADGWPLAHAGIVASDGATAPGEIRLEHGLLTVAPKNSGTVSLEVLFPLGDGGEGRPKREVLLTTTLLPQRERPYLLSLELARKQLMRFLNALEEWNLAMLPAEHPALVTFERAREDFSAALVSWRNVQRENADADDPALVAAESKSRRALADASEASELLVAEAVKRGLAARADGSWFADAVERAERSIGRPATKPVAVVKAPEAHGVTLAGVARVGCSVDPRSFEEPAQAALSKVADFITVPMPWAAIEPAEGKYQFGATDRWIEWAVRKGKLPVVAGPVLDFAPGRLPEWLFIWENDHDTLRELVYEHMRQVVTRYRRTVQWWTIASALGVEGALSLRFEQIADLLRVASMVTRKLQPNGRVQVEIVDPFALYASRGPRVVPPLLLGELITQSGMHVDAIGLRIDLTDERTAGVVRDGMAFSEMLDRYATLDRPVSITFAACPSAPAQDQNERGSWNGPWSADVQADWARQMLSIAAAKPYVHSVCWGLAQDTPGLASGPGLVSAQGAARPALSTIGQLRQAVRAGAQA
ncbi:MAG: endo-1,4-beta-xylanase [Phycisphaerales bacterium JB064]